MKMVYAHTRYLGVSLKLQLRDDHNRLSSPCRHTLGIDEGNHRVSMPSLTRSGMRRAATGMRLQRQRSSQGRRCLLADERASACA